MVPGAFYISKERPGSKPQGEDAHFICAEKQAIGVADGVGGCARAGVDPGDYARQLMANSFAAIRMEPEGSADLRRVLNRAFSKTKAKGSSTACIVTLVDHVDTLPFSSESQCTQSHVYVFFCCVVLYNLSFAQNSFSFFCSISF